MISPSENLSPRPVLAAAIVSKPAATEGQIAGTHVRSPQCRDLGARKRRPGIITVPPKPKSHKQVWARARSGSKSGLRVKIWGDLTLRCYVDTYEHANESSLIIGVPCLELFQ